MRTTSYIHLLVIRLKNKFEFNFLPNDKSNLNNHK